MKIIQFYKRYQLSKSLKDDYNVFIRTHYRMHVIYILSNIILIGDDEIASIIMLTHSDCIETIYNTVEEFNNSIKW